MIDGKFLASSTARHLAVNGYEANRSVRYNSENGADKVGLFSAEVDFEVGERRSDGGRDLKIVVESKDYESIASQLRDGISGEFWKGHDFSQEFRRRRNSILGFLKKRDVSVSKGAVEFSAYLTTQNEDTAFRVIYNEVIRPVLAHELGRGLQNEGNLEKVAQRKNS